MKRLSYIGQDGVIIRVEDSGKVQEIRFSDIEKFWDYANEDDFEGGSAKIIGSIVFFTMITAGGQGEIIVGWDLEKNNVVHISNGEFCTDFTLYNDMLYLLCEVSDFNSAAHFLVFRVPFGTMDTAESGTRLYCENPCEVTGDPSLEVSEKGIQVITEGKEYLFASSVEGARTSPAIGFEKYYVHNAMADHSMSGMLL